MCKRVHLSEKIPDSYTRAVNFLCAIDNTAFYKLEKMLEDDDRIDEDTQITKHVTRNT